MGEPTGGNAPVPTPEHIGREEASGGTETSKYPEEKKATAIPRVAASEKGTAQTCRMSSPQALSGRGCRTFQVSLRRHRGVTKSISSRRVLERPATEGNSPVGERDGPPGGYPEYGGTGEIPSESAGTTPQG
jgi:hypothetical protein